MKTHKKAIQKGRTKKIPRQQKKLTQRGIKNDRRYTRYRSKKIKRISKTYNGGATQGVGELPTCLKIYSGDSITECETELLKKFIPDNLTMEQLKKNNNHLLNIYRKVLLISPNSEDYRKKMPENIRKYIDDINRKNLLACKEGYSRLKSGSTNVGPLIKGDLSKLNAEYVAKILGLNLKRIARKEDIIKYFTGITLSKKKNNTSTPASMEQFNTTTGKN